MLYYPPVAQGGKREWLKWSYTINAANYQIIVLDTRNWRSYPGPLGYDPPQLLSDEAWNMQLVEDAAPPGTAPDLTFIVSPAVPLAAPVVEYAQEKAKVKEDILDNDVEGWTAQARSFQLLLSKLATRNLGTQEQAPRQRKIVMLSGDVHYSHAVRIEYWANRPYESEVIDTHAIFALFTASSLRNEEDKFGVKDSMFLHDHGYEALGMANKRDWVNYFGWDNKSKQRTEVGQGRAMSADGLSQWKWTLNGESPDVVCIDRKMQELRAPYAELHALSDWRYTVRYFDSQAARPVPRKTIDSQGKQAHAEAHKQHFQYANVQGPGMQIVGRNNLGEITFQFADGDTTRTRIGQWLWWRDPESETLSARTFHIISLEFNDAHEFPDPNTKVGLTGG